MIKLITHFIAPLLLLSLIGCKNNEHTPLAVCLQDDTLLIDNYTLSLPPTEDTPNIGLAGMFAGAIDNNIVLLGGANFPNGLPKEGGKKMWHGDLYVYNNKAGWSLFPDFTHPIAYGISVSIPEGVLCVGGCNSDSCFSSCFAIRFTDGKPAIRNYPPLPAPMANGAGALVGDSLLFVAGGQSTMQHYAATRRFYRLNLNRPEEGWKEFPAWDGGARGYSVAVGTDSCFYLLSGRDYDHEEHWTVWSDGYCYNIHTGVWYKLDGYYPVMAGTGCATGHNRLLLVGGRSPKSNVGENFVHLLKLPDETPISCDLGDYDLPVTTASFILNDTVYIASGEVSPGVRTPTVYKLFIK